MSIPICMYATLPLQIGAIAGAQGLQRIDWKQFATSPQLVLCLEDMNGVPMDLTGVQAVTLHLSPLVGGGVTITEAMTLLYANGGLVGYRFQESDVALSGTFNMEVEVMMTDGSGMYFPSTGYLPFVINPSLDGGNT